MTVCILKHTPGVFMMSYANNETIYSGLEVEVQFVDFEEMSYEFIIHVALIVIDNTWHFAIIEFLYRFLSK